MSENPIIVANEFPGLFTNVTANAIKPGGAQAQVNCRSVISGQLDVRGGLRPTSFSNATTATSFGVISIYQSPTPLSPVILYETADGAIRMGRNPSIS